MGDNLSSLELDRLFIREWEWFVVALLKMIKHTKIDIYYNQ